MVENTTGRAQRIAADGEPASVRPEWGTTVRSEWTTFILHPPVDYELAYKVDRYVAILPFGTAVTEASVGDGPMLRTRLRAGGITFVEPGTRVRARQVEPLEFLVLSIDPARVRRLGEAQAARWHARTVVDLLDPAIAALAGEMRRSMLGDHLADPAYLQSLVDALLTRLLCHFLGEFERDGGGEALPPGKLARILRHIEENLDGKLRVDELAGMAGLTRSHFSRAFQRATGAPPQRFILTRRLCRARDLLAGGDDALARIAVRSGFSSQAHMSTAFRQEVGTTPRKYREAFGREGN